jgi:hypothetical protein
MWSLEEAETWLDRLGRGLLLRHPAEGHVWPDAWSDIGGLIGGFPRPYFRRVTI